jgi:DNA repair exonuclease SbcCD ATPase subunit
MAEASKRINIRIPVQLYNRVEGKGYGLTEAIIKGLELLLADVIAEGKDIKSDILVLQEDRIKDLQRQIEDLQGQAKGRDEQLKVKDAQIEKLNENMHELTETMHAQSVHIQTLLSQQKQIPEYTEKKPWWKFW